MHHVHLCILQLNASNHKILLFGVSGKLTDHGLNDAFCHFDELLVDLDGEITQHLSVLSQVKVLQTVLVLFGRVLCHKCLMKKMSGCESG